MITYAIMAIVYKAFMGGGSLPLLLTKKGGESMTIFQSLILCISFASLIVAILSFHQKK